MRIDDPERTTEGNKVQLTYGGMVPDLSIRYTSHGWQLTVFVQTEVNAFAPKQLSVASLPSMQDVVALYWADPEQWLEVMFGYTGPKAKAARTDARTLSIEDLDL